MTTLCAHGLTRRAVLLSGVIMAALAARPASSRPTGPLQFRVATPTPDAASLMAALAPPVEKSLGMPVQVVPFRREPDGRWPVEVVYAASPDSLETLVAGAPHLFSIRKYSSKVLDPAALTKITKLTRGESFGLLVPKDPPGEGLGALARMARGRKLRIAVSDALNGHALFADLLGKEAGIAIEKAPVTGDAGAIAAVSTGTADAAVVVTNAFGLVSASHPDLRVLATSGAKRSSKFPTTPTLAEITAEPRLSFSVSLGLFGPPRMPAETAKRIDAAARAAAAIPSVRAAALQLGYVLDPLGPEGLAIDSVRIDRAMQVLRNLG